MSVNVTHDFWEDTKQEEKKQCKTCNKFKPLDSTKSKIYNSSNNKETKDLSPKDVINFVRDFI